MEKTFTEDEDLSVSFTVLIKCSAYDHDGCEVTESDIRSAVESLLDNQLNEHMNVGQAESFVPVPTT